MNQQQPQHHQAQPQVATYSDFAGTHPPIFAKSNDPLEADSWIELMESKFDLIACTEEQKALFIAHQLRGPAASLWLTYRAMQSSVHTIELAEFRVALCDFYNSSQ